MEIFNSIEEYKPNKKPILTLGMFDGVHLGHQDIIKNLNTLAKIKDGKSVILTFNPHPRMVLQENCDLKFIYTLEEKEQALKKIGLDQLIVQPFTKEFSQLSSLEFVRDLLVNKISIDTLVIGHDHHFGKNREGNFTQLEKLSKEYGFNLLQINEITTKENIAISSTKIRKALSLGDIEYVNNALNCPYPISGEVIHGDKLGRTLGYPTANLKVDPLKIIPKNGVYSVEVFVDNKKYIGLLSIGFRETVTNSKELRVEVNILNFNEDIYGKTIHLNILERIRDEKKFDSLDDLIQAMDADKIFTINKYL